MTHNQWFTQIHDLLPGSKKLIINGPTYNVEQFCEDAFSKIPNDCDTVILNTLDVWDTTSNIRFLDHPKLLNKNFFLVGLGYQNRQLGPQQWEIASHAFYLTRNKKQMSIKSPGLKTGFSCLNNRVTTARLILGYQLWCNNLLEEVIFSQNTYGNWWEDSSYQQPDVTRSLLNFQQYLNLLPIVVPGDILPDTFLNDHSTDHVAYSDAYCNIVTETEVGDDIYLVPSNKLLEIVTEKSYKPFISCQVPLMLASAGHVRCLTDLGFEMMEDLLPTNFDSLGSHERINAVVNVVAKGKDYIENFYFEHRREIEHNYDLVMSNKVEQQILQTIKNFVES